MGMKKNRKTADTVKGILQALAWVVGIACIVYALSFLVRRSYDIMKKNTETGYIGKPDVEVRDGKMTPEILLSYGRVSDPQLSPDGSRILYNHLRG